MAGETLEVLADDISDSLCVDVSEEVLLRILIDDLGRYHSGSLYLRLEPLNFSAG